MQKLDNITRWATRGVIWFVLILILSVSCVQIYDRFVFHSDVLDSAKSYVETIKSNPICQYSPYAHKPNNIKCNHIPSYNCSYNDSIREMESLIDVFSKSDGILGANGLTLIVTLIVSLLAALLLNRIEKIEELVEKNRKLEEKSESYYLRRTKLDVILARVKSIYNLSIIIGNVSMTLSPYKSYEENKVISSEMGNLCSRLSRICSQIDNIFDSRKYKFVSISTEEKNMFDIYIDDAIGELDRSVDIVNRLKLDKSDCITFEHLENILKMKMQRIEEIKVIINLLEIEEERKA